MISLKDMHILNTKGRKIYSYDFHSLKYHSGTVTVRLYLKPNISYENSYDKDGNNPLINLYYKSGSYESKPIYHTFEIAQTLIFKDIKNKVSDEITDNNLQQEINNSFKNSQDDIDNLSNQINNRLNTNINIIHGIYHLNKLISTKQLLNSTFKDYIHLLKLKNVPNTFNFNNASTNEGTSNLSNI